MIACCPIINIETLAAPYAKEAIHLTDIRTEGNIKIVTQQQP